MRLSEWNEALVKAVFLDPERVGATVCRMDATGQLLERISGTSGIESAKRQFIAAFGRDATAIRQLYRASISLTQAKAIPSSFAALYLTLLAASGDDKTSGEGVFRRRFAAMLGIDERATFDFGELPRMWEELARWCERRAKAMGDCPRLILPDPRNENRIGYSKRLAFPTFADEKRLRQLVAETGISSASAFQVAEQTIFANLNDFSDSFRQEALIFQDLVARGRSEDAFHSPLWGALRDIGFALEKKSSDATGRIGLELDLADPLAPEIAILADEKGALAAALSGSVRLQRSRAPYIWTWRAQGLDASIKPLTLLGAKDRNFSRVWLARALRAGCLPLFPDAFGRLSSDGDYWDDGPVALIALRAQMGSVMKMANHLNVAVRVPATASTAGKWTALLIPGISRVSLERLASTLPPAIRALLMPAWKPDRLRIAEAARYGDAVLLNPAASPEVRLREATSGSYELVSADGREIAKGDLEAHGDGFRIPPKDLAALASTATCDYRLKGAGAHGAVEAATKVAVLPAAPAIPLKPLSDPLAWLCDGHGAALGGLELARPEAHSICPSSQRLLRRLSEPVLPSRHDPDIADRSMQALDWIGEALLTRFQQRATLPFEEITERVGSAAEAVGLPAWAVKKALFASGWLVSIQKRTARFQEVALGERVLVVTSLAGRTTARLSGLVGRNEITQLRGLLVDGESCMPTAPERGQLAVGTWTLSLADSGRAIAIADCVGLRVRHKTAPLPCPLAGALRRAVRSDKTHTLLYGSDTWAWDGRRRRWCDEGEMFAEAVILCNRGSQRDTYWVRSASGLFQTDSFSWAQMLARLGSGLELGVLAEDGSAQWDSEFVSIPLPLSYWWMQEGGGSLGVDREGAILFLGGGGLEQWRGHFEGPAIVAEAGRDRAKDRRELALDIRRRGRRNYQAA